MKLIQLFPTLFGIAILAACQSSPMQPAAKQARATLESKSGSTVAGTVDFTERGDKVIVTTRVSGLQPNTVHGFHVHEKGDCSAPDAMSAGGHFNPDSKPHAGPMDSMHHAGDMGNLTSDGNGEANVSIEMDTIRVDDSQHGILNRAVVIHANPDDFKTQPTGNSGGRVACGVIKKV
jgi:Cu-Zn family superoxide dismutase